MTLKQAAAWAKKMAQPADYTAPLRACGQVMLSGVKKCFQTSADPKGRPWKPLRFRAGKALLDTGTLRNSISVKTLNSKEVIVGTNLKYARVHQEGGVAKVTPRMRRFLHSIGIHLNPATTTIRIPARPYIGHRPENWETYRKIFRDFAKRRAHA